MRRLLLAWILGALLGCAQSPPNGPGGGPQVSGTSARRTTLMERYSACLGVAQATMAAEAALRKCRPELEASVARIQPSPRPRAAMIDAIEFDGKVLLGLADDPSTDAKPNRPAWALCLMVKSVELDDAVSPTSQVAVAVERACRPFAVASGRVELDTAAEVVQRVRAGQW